MRLLLAAAALLIACGSPPSHLPADLACVPGPGTELELYPVASGLKDPVFITAPPGDHRMFILEQPGRIRILRAGALVERPFLAIEDLVEDLAIEQGLLGLAFHPDFAGNGRFFVYYSKDGGASQVVAEYRVAADDPDVADAGSARVLLDIADPFGSHNAGMIAFGPRDGYLYIATGDGGGRNDEFGNGQNLTSLWGKILRIDVDGGEPYAIPPGNPYADSANGPDDPRPETWAWGLRNPWRFSFDRDTGDMFIGDVGQKAYEEINVLRAGDPGGTNFGWSTMEGIICFFTGGCDMNGLTGPVVAYPHSGTCAVIGGYVYRGECIPDVTGWYFYSDHCSNQIFTLRYPDAVEPVDWTPHVAGQAQLDRVSSYGESPSGELYIVSRGNGTVFKLIRAGTGPET